MKNNLLSHLRSRLARFDTNSLRFKLWAYFFLFAVCLMAALWLMQTIFLQPYYQEMKSKDILRTAHSIASAYSQASDLDADALHAEIKNIAYKNDMYIYLQSTDGEITLRSDSDTAQYYPPGIASFRVDERFRILQRQLAQSPSGTITLKLESPSGKNDMMAFGQLIETKNRSDALLCIFTTLTPLESTINILASQLIIVTFASLTLACALSFWISRRVTRPIFAITKKANQLAVGEYGITFDGGHYSEIQDLANTLTYTSNELAKADNLQKDLIANVSHDLRTPLTMVKSYAEMIRDLSGDNPQKRNAHLQVIIDEADRLNLLVNDLLLLSKMQSGVETMQVESFDLRDSVVSLLNTYAILEEQDGYQFILCCGEESVMVRGDSNRLKQVISNLLNNAVRYGGDGRRITVTLEPVVSGLGLSVNGAPAADAGADDSERAAYGDIPAQSLSQLASQIASQSDGQTPTKAKAGKTRPGRSVKPSAVRVSVSDEGPGIPPDELEHIWERYYKVSKTGTRAVSGGTGLGLSIVKEILALHNAKFGVTSKVGEGSTFWFELPL